MASQPGSRAGLITALVIFVIAFFVALIFAVVKGSDYAKLQLQLDQVQKTYATIISNNELSTNRSEIETILGPEKNSRRTVWDILTHQRDDLSKVIAGSTNADVSGTVKAANDALADLNTNKLKSLNLTVPTSSMKDALVAMADALVKQKDQVDAIKAQNAELARQVKDKEAVRVQLAKDFDGKVSTATAEATKAADEADAYRKTKDAQILEKEKAVQEMADNDRKAVEKVKTDLDAATAQLAKVVKERDALIKKLWVFRPRNLADSSIRRPDGKIIQVGKNNVVYINLGMGQQISPGMTFEIYDRIEGIPATDSGDDQLPVGKGSLEVVRVSPDSSECRLVKVNGGQQIMEGDIIANLIYDPNVKWSFKAYGDFDIDQNGVATPAETEVVKRLIVQWGGKLTDKISIDTDFLVLGKEPVVPNYTKDQIDSNPLLKFEQEKATAALSAYMEVRNQALELHIPVLSQNRFLYMIGFYDQAKK